MEYLLFIGTAGIATQHYAMIKYAIDLVYSLVYYLYEVSEMQVNTHEAKTKLSELLKRVNAGEEVIIARAGKPIARLVSYTYKPEKRVPGSAEGRITMAEDFNEPLPENIIREFEG